MALSETNLLADFPADPTVASGGGAFNIAVYAIISMFVLVGIAYLLSRALNNRRLEDWAKDEFLQALVSAAIVGALVLLLAPKNGLIIGLFNTLTPENLEIPVWNSYLNYVGSSGTTALLTGSGPGVSNEQISASFIGCPAGSSGTILCFSYSYMTLLEHSIIQLSADLLTFNILIELLASLSFNLILVQLTPLSGLTSVSQVVGSIIQSLLFLGVMSGVQLALLHFINSTALTIFLPIGVVLRCFFATRKIGGLLMGIAIGLYLVYPLILAMNAIAVNESNKVDFTELENLFKDVKDANPYGEGENPDEGEWGNFLTDFSEKLSKLKQGIAALPHLWIQLLASLVIQIVFLPVLSVLITLISIKELAALFGSEVNLGRFEV